VDWEGETVIPDGKKGGGSRIYAFKEITKQKNEGKEKPSDGERQKVSFQQPTKKRVPGVRQERAKMIMRIGRNLVSLWKKRGVEGC